MGNRNTYQINGQTYWQDTLVLGQAEHLTPLLDGLSMPDGNIQVVIKAMGPKLYRALACVLVQEGQTQQDLVTALDQGKLEELAARHRNQCRWDVAVQVVTDFFDCNPVTTLPALLMSINRIMGSTTAGVLLAAETLRPSMPSSVPETSASAPVSAER
jgi:hypothetical protein